MSSPLVIDTNVFIDLIKVEALQYFLALPYTFYTTDFVVNEVNVPEQAQELARCLALNPIEIVSFSGTEVAAILRHPIQRNLKRLTDRSVLYLSLQRDYKLLSGDGDLRKEAQQQGVKVYGSLWAIQQMVEQNHCSRKEGRLFLHRLTHSNPRLPKKVVEEMLLAFAEEERA
jgi:predicted nucleic acid-binding protein